MDHRASLILSTEVTKDLVRCGRGGRNRVFCLFHQGPVKENPLGAKQNLSCIAHSSWTAVRVTLKTGWKLGVQLGKHLFGELTAKEKE
jgi:hypothetical protein